MMPNLSIHSVVHPGRLTAPLVKQKKLVWSDDANKLVWDFIEPKILFDSEIISGEDTSKIKVCPVNKDAYNSELEKKHRDELQYGIMMMMSSLWKKDLNKDYLLMKHQLVIVF